MLTTPTPVPQNSTSPLPSNWGNVQLGSIYYLYAAGLTQEPTVACAPGPEAFADLAPAGTLFPVVTENAEYPALSQCVLSPAAVSPLAAQVYQTQQAMLQGLVGNANADLTSAVSVAGQSGAVTADSDISGAAEVYPMSYTAGLIQERTPYAQRVRRKGPPRDPNFPGTPWGGVSVSVPQGGCGGGLSGWGLLFLLAGAGLAIAAMSGDT